jgi:HD-GYP domain-containing protein (c-di-GMP phosphodiesterase class II)
MILASVVEQIAGAISVSYGFEAVSLFLVDPSDGILHGVGIGNTFRDDTAARTGIKLIEAALDAEGVNSNVYHNFQDDENWTTLSYLLHPIIYQFGVVRVDLPNLGTGYVFVCNSEQRSIDQLEFSSDVHRLSLHAGNLMEPLNTLQDYQRNFTRMHELSMLEIAVNGSTSLETSLDLMLNNGKAIFGYDAAIITKFNQTTLHLDYLAGYGLLGSSPERYSTRLGNELAGQAALERRMVGGEINLETLPHYHFQQLVTQERFQYHFAIPIEAKGSLKGVLEVFYRQTKKQEDSWYSLLEVFVSKLGGIMFDAEVIKENQKLYLELESAYDSICRTWMHEIETYLQEPMGHTESLANMAVGLGRHCGLGRDDLTNLYRGVLLHDIGMLRVPAGVINRRDRFDDQSRKLIQMHPLYAYDQLGTIDRLKPAMEIPLHHHERWDGSGYPFQLKKDQIPLAARIFAVVDVWDAMRSPRPHRPALADQAIQHYLHQQSGNLFDPEIINLFISLNPLP